MALSWREKRELPATAAADAEMYVAVRNSILCKWLNKPNEYLTRAEATRGLRVLSLTFPHNGSAREDLGTPVGVKPLTPLGFLRTSTCRQESWLMTFSPVMGTSTPVCLIIHAKSGTRRESSFLVPAWLAWQRQSNFTTWATGAPLPHSVVVALGVQLLISLRRHNALVALQFWKRGTELEGE